LQTTTTRQAQVEQSEGITREDRIMRRVFLSPAVIVLLLLSIFPMFWSLGISFTNIQRGATPTEAAAEVITEEGGSAAPSLGFELTTRNFTRMLEDQRLLTAARNTLFYVFAGVIIQYIMGFGLALVLNQEFFARNVVRVIFLMPMMMTPVAAAYSGRMLFDSTLSPLAQLFRTISRVLGLEQPIVIPWLTNGNVAPWTIVLIDSWQWIPFVTLILLSGLQSIPDVNSVIVYLAVLSAISFLRMFDLVQNMSFQGRGGPLKSTTTVVLEVYNEGFSSYNMGYASALTVILFALILLITVIQLRLLSRRVEY